MSAEALSRTVILRPDNLGDVILFSGALRHLRNHYPSARITMVVKRYVTNYLELCPYVDELLSWEELGGLTKSLPHRWRGGRLEAAARLPQVWARLSADVLLLPVRSPTPVMRRVARAIPAREKVGIEGDATNDLAAAGRQPAGTYSAVLEFVDSLRWEHEIGTTARFLRVLGIEVGPADLWPQVWTDDADHHWAAAHVPRPDGTVLLGIAPGVSSDRMKAYPAGGYAAALSELPATQFAVVLFGAASEREMCNAVGVELRGARNVVSVTNLAGLSSVRELTEGIKRCDAVISVETAALHLTTALRVPCVGIIGGGHYGRFYPWGNPAINRVAHRPMECYHCNWHCQFNATRCIAEIAPQTIAAELQTALYASHAATMPS